tara:strand:- start:423 stop:899 length:477 start_codon:yes stop_codon:yes gene_type:complete
MFKTINNFLEQKDISLINNLIISPNFGWYAKEGVVSDDDGVFLFTHILFNGKINSDFFHTILDPFILKLKIKQLMRSKLNLYPSTKTIEKHDYHIDNEKKHKVALFYLNTNNGKTLFKDKSVPSVKNKLVLFDGNQKHASTTCTDVPYRITLNINYVL